jgi:signal transduction histidine kinase
MPNQDKSERFCVVLLQNRKDTEYNDFVGKFYHFPKKYLNLLSNPNVEFVYYEPEKKGEGVYFGYGKIVKIFPDKREEDCYFAEIVGYKPFSTPIEFNSKNGQARENGATYNAQNVVRRIPADILDGICLDGGIVLNFKADAHLLKVLGEQLIASEQVGILELVKNAYDAGASKCIVRIENIPSLPPKTTDYEYKQYPGPVVVIRDNGRGMDRFTIEHGWMRPASTIKTNVKERLKQERQKAIEKGSLGTFKTFIKTLKEEHGGRIPLGEKGVGRFATHRLGRNVIIKTKTSDSEQEFVLKINWDEFEETHSGDFIDLDTVGVALSRQIPSRDYGPTGSGTEIIIFSGRPEYPLTETIIRQVARTINKLRSPNRGPSNFDAEFLCPQVPDTKETPYSKVFPPIFTLDAIVDDNGMVDFDLAFNPPHSVPLNSQTIKKTEYSLLTTSKDYWTVGQNNNEFRKPRCGAFFLHIDFWYRSTPWIDGPEKTPFIQYLDTYGGISIFRDGLNIFPAEWGAEVDWLELSKRHIGSGDRLSYREMIGNLEINQTTNLELVDKTDRQGMIRNEAYRDLSKLVQALILFVENEFKGKRIKFSELTAGVIREPKKLGDISRQSASLIGSIAAKYDVERDPLQLLIDFGPANQRASRLLDLNHSLKNLQKSLKLMEEVQDVLAEQAGFGLSIAVSVHEIAKITANFYYSVSKLLKSKTPDNAELEKLRDSSESLNSELKRLGPLRAVRNEKPKVFGARSAVNYCFSLFERRFNKSNITYKINMNDDFQICARFGAVVQVITNLLDNSCYWLEVQRSADRVIQINIVSESRIILVGDSGPGVDEAIRPYLFQPGYICKHYMRTTGGDIYEATIKDRTKELGGAQFILDFARVPLQKENE